MDVRRGGRRDHFGGPPSPFLSILSNHLRTVLAVDGSYAAPYNSPPLTAPGRSKTTPPYNKERSSGKGSTHGQNGLLSHRHQQTWNQIDSCATQIVCQLSKCVN